MRAVLCHELGPVENLRVEDVPMPEPGPGQLRVAVKAAGASFADGLRVQGKYQFPMSPPYTPGGEAAGVVDAVGEGVAGWSVGDRVYAVANNGAFAEAMIVKPHTLVRLPDSVDFARGASFHQVYGTAWFALKYRTVVRPGETMLVTGAGGGVGLAAIDVARSLGARVIAVASSQEKRALALEMGAEAAIDPALEDVKTRARELTDGKGIDLVYDVTGGEVAEAGAAGPGLRRPLPGDRVHRPASRGSPLNLVLLNNRTVIGVEWGGWVTAQRRGEPADDRRIVLAAIDRGELHPVAPFERPLGDAGAVLAELLGRRAVGKIVLVP